MNNRIKFLRKSLKLNQTEFSEPLGVKQSTLSAYESGVNDIPNVFVKSLCAAYGVSETWLRTGEGDMYQELTEDEALAETFGSILSDETDPSKRAAVKGVLALLDQIPPEFYPEIADFCERLAKHKK